MVLPVPCYASPGMGYRGDRKSNAYHVRGIRGVLARAWICCIVLMGIPIQVMFICFYLLHLVVFAICTKHQQIQDRRRQRLRAEAWSKALNSKYPATIYGDISLCGDATCIVCLDEIRGDDLARRLSCNHVYHAACIFEWCQRRSRCPLCNQTLHLDVNFESVKM
mmetsp:Transcript_9062/g.27232  ORF Transcript_9062/g.27232 Transcript_9062/m.27232 type:complete len:165 (+) Transcript_9062:70-564(+)